MKRACALLVVFLAAAGCASQTHVQPLTIEDLRDVRTARLTQRLQARLVVTVIDARVARLGGESATQASEELARAGVTMGDEVGLQLVEHYPVEALGLYVYVLEGDSRETVDRAETLLKKRAHVQRVQRANLFRTQAAAPVDNVSPVVDEPFDRQRGDPLGPMQGLPAEELAKLHNVATGRGVTIAVIDTGVDRDHEDLRGAALTTRDLVSDSSPVPVETHSTAVTGLMIARSDNGTGIAGIAPAARVIALRACWQDTADDRAYCNTFTLARALAVALEADVDIVNLSLTGPMDPFLAQLVDALLARNVIVVAANADEPGQGPFPSALPGVIAATSRPVLAGDPGPVYAPGDDIITLLPGNRYGLRSGSSLSAAQVSAVAGLFRERDPTITAAALEAILHGRGVEQEGLAGLLEALRKTAH